MTVTDPSGLPLSDHDVTVGQRRHAFAFGNIGFDFVHLVGGPPPQGVEQLEGFGGDSTLPLEELTALWERLFNTATLPFYWGRYEPVRGRRDHDRLDRTARWLANRGITVKGHPLVWHTVQPDWLLGPPEAEVEAALRERIRSLVGGFAGVIDTWDVLNEGVILPLFSNGANALTPLARSRGRLAVLRLAFEEAHAANPSATLLLNDFDLTSAYDVLLDTALDAGLPISAIGLQTHMHQGFRGEDYLQGVLDRFARFGLPLHMTETSGHREGRCGGEATAPARRDSKPQPSDP